MAAQARTLKVKIMNVEPDPLHKGRTIVSAQFDDGDTLRGPWIQGFSMLPQERPISPEEFMVSLKGQEIKRPVDAFQYLRDAADNGKQYDLTISDIDDPPTA
jgi:hypothetical protein